LRADRAARIHVAGNDGPSRRRTILLGLLAAAALWAAILIPAVLSAGS
jgi:MYXO-CTERM domain-containing protein